MAPAFTDVGTARFFAHSVEIFLAENSFEAQVVRIPRRLDLNPVRMSPRHRRSRSSEFGIPRPGLHRGGKSFRPVQRRGAWFQTFISEDVDEAVEKSFLDPP